MSTIALCVVAYQAETMLPTLLKSVAGHVDHLVLGIDAKTTDNTRGVAQDWAKKHKVGLVLHDFRLEDADDPAGPKDFARARNENWALIPTECDWAIWLDTDDELGADVNLHRIADETPAGATQVWLRYAYFRDAHGNVTTLFSRERLIRLSAKRTWTRRLHEILITDPATRVDDDRAWVEHKNRTDEPEKGQRNFTTLAKIIEEKPDDPWGYLYLAHQHFGAHGWDEAVKGYLRFLTLTTDPAERWQAFVMCAKAYRNAGKFQDSLNASTGAIREIPGWADPYYEMAYSHQAMEDFPRAVQWYEEAVKRTVPDDRRILHNPLDYDFNPAVTIHTSYAVMGNVDKAKALLDGAVKIRPDPELLKVRGLYDRTLSRREAISAGIKLASHLYKYGEPAKAMEVLDTLPAGSAQETRTVDQVRTGLHHEMAFTKTDNAYENRYFLDPELATPDVDAPTPEERWLLARLRRAGARRVLDIGIGNGQTALYLAKNGIAVVGLDVDPRRVKAANFASVEHGHMTKKYSRAHGRSVPVQEKHHRGCASACSAREHLMPDLMAQFWYGRAEKVPEKVKALGLYDAVLLDGVLNRVRDVDATLASAHALAPRVLVTVPDGGSIHTEYPRGNLRAYERNELEGLLLPHGQVVESHPLSDTQLALEYTIGPDGGDGTPAVIWCGPGWERWSPDQIDRQGLGGSETAVVKLAEELVGRGMRVMVYAEAEGTWNGVHYRHHSKWNAKMPTFMFISWRQPGVFDVPIEADQKYLWMHDIDAGDTLTAQRAVKIDRLWVMSRWHRSHLLQKYGFLRDEQIIVLGNGIDPSRFDGDAGLVERDNAAIYSSSPDRGLEQALTYWPEIHKKTGAELRVFYGWETWDRMRGDVRQPGYKQKIMDLAKQDGVVWKGRVGQRDLGQEMLKAKVLFYPGPHEFCETFCITALEAQAAACVPDTRDNGALPETNRHGTVVPNDAKPARWVAAVQEALTTSETDRSKMRQWALGQTWAAVAERVMQGSIALDKITQDKEQELALPA